MTRSRRTSMEGFATLLLWFSFFSILIISGAVDTITAPQFIRDGETIVSTDGSFELGFFSPNNSTNRFVGIWFKKISPPTIVWVANRDIPLVDSSGILKVTDTGILTVINGNDSVIWSSNSTRLAQNPFAQLLDSGNLVVRNGNDYNQENFLWQSFDYPCDTILPGMEFGINLETGLDRYLTSWKSSNDPSRGDYTARFDPRGFPEIVVMKDSVEQFRSGPWNGLYFSGIPHAITDRYYTYNFVFNDKEIYYSFEPPDSRVVSRLVLDQNGSLQGFIWINQSHGFVPKFPKEWAVADWSNGCVRRTQLDCQNGDRFLKYSGIKLPATRNSWFNRSMTLEECKMECLKNCSCVAYANLDIKLGGSGCLLWFGDLIDIKEYNQNGQDIYIRLASSEIGQLGSSKKKKLRYIAGSVLLAVMLLLGLSLTVCLRRKNKLRRQGRLGHNLERNDTTECQTDPEIPLFDYATIANATNNFSISNKLGEGGFGPVYKVTIV
ncbi:hypothetical protein F0562_008879 [Nyssa sinensis]|uniref:Bulb-type lectin domain-containing protein n=1 Tax=Nyssa sinensis TaxID=561372 RepID=A0A5J5AAH8_9ASTE|nr:hypothetical protein F0562_008879 [Nyssa sinensis]